jgi:hypothetical protein
VPHSSLAVFCETRVGILTLILNTSVSSALKLLAFARILDMQSLHSYWPLNPKVPARSWTPLRPTTYN